MATGDPTTEAVIFDWGGTLTPWHTIDHVALWQAVCQPHFPDDHEQRASAAHAAEMAAWELVRGERRSSTLLSVLEVAGIDPTQALFATYLVQWEPHTYTDPAAAATLRALREQGLKIGVLSNTLWPRDWHEDVFRRDGILDLIDGAVYSSEIDWAKPHPEAFRAAMAAVGATDPSRCVFVGDRPWDDIHGAKSVGMRAVLVPHSQVPTFEEAKPDAIIAGLSELPALIRSWSAGRPGPES
ncbi:MAG TPA: HAD family hydrolase [Streptosporangiaceae bacterium]|nr:HAD family hydrolase [Streptosporangiaceae bacterium]